MEIVKNIETIDLSPDKSESLQSKVERLNLQSPSSTLSSSLPMQPPTPEHGESPLLAKESIRNQLSELFDSIKGYIKNQEVANENLKVANENLLKVLAKAEKTLFKVDNSDL